MRVAYLECFAGISGDMLLGALVDAGVPVEVLMEATSALHLNASLKIGTVDRSGISCTKVHVLEGGHVAEETKAQHTHEHGHTHKHSHGRSLRVIREMIQAAALVEPVKRMAIHAFELLGASEAKIHNVDVEKIHFHEVGAVDAIVDIVAACAGIDALGINAWHCSALNVGGGMVECAHGTFPVPAPATADLLRGYPTYSAHVEKELVTPTGAALLRALEPVFGAQPPMRVEKIGYGAGSRNPKGFPNALRLSVGDAEVLPQTEMVTVLETALDDLSPQVLAWVAETALAAGAMDVMLTPVIMKKGRPGTLLTVLCSAEKSEALTRLILRETSTLGVRVRQDQRVCLERHHTAVLTAYGEVRMKIGSLAGEEMNAAPEFEDCRAAAMKHDVPLKRVQQMAIAAYHAAREQRAGGAKGMDAEKGAAS
jgi:uncharacterized protein (TIGR00299 family) protein